MANHVFISHSSDDKTVARDICGELEDRELDVWIAPRDITGGENYKVAIYEAVRDAEAVLLLMSNHANQSDHTEREIDIADDYDVPVIPILIEDVEIPARFKYMLTNIQRISVDNPPTDGDYNRVIRSIVSNTSIETGPSENQDRDATKSRTGTDPTLDELKSRAEDLIEDSQERGSAGGTRKSLDNCVMHRYGAARTGSPENTRGPTEGVKIKWKYKTNASIMSSPVVVNGIVYFGSDDGYVYALNAKTGNKEWHFETGGESIKSSPVVVDGIVYIGCNDHNVYALNAKTGEKQWHFETGDEVWSSPAVNDGIVYIGSSDHNVYALNAKTGKKQWQFETGDEVRSSPAVDDGVVWVGSDDCYVYGLDAETGKKQLYIETEDYIGQSSPAVVDNKIYIMDQLKLYEIKSESNKYHNLTLPDRVFASPTVVDDTVYFGDFEDTIFAINASTFESQWQTRVDDGITHTAAVVDDIVYLGSKDNHVYALDAKTGNKEWQFETDNSVLCAPAVTDSTVYIGSTDMYLYALEQVGH